MAELPENLPIPPPPPHGQGDQPYDSHETQATSYPGYEEAMYGSPPTGHSGLGIASMAIGIISVLLGIIGMAITVNVVTQHPNIMNIQPGEQPPEEFIGIMGTISSLVCGSGILSVLGLVLGIIGLVQATRLKLFAVIGTILNGVVVVGMTMMFLFGLVAGR